MGQPTGSLVATSAVNVGVAATAIVAINADRTGVVLRNNGANTIFIGGAGVTLANGMPLEPGEAAAPGDTLMIPATAAIFGIVAAATEEVRVLEITD